MKEIIAMSQENQTILITGSTDGLGRETAMRLGTRGRRLLVHGRSRDRGTQVVTAIHQQGGEAVFHQADIASQAGVRALADAVLKNEPKLDVLVNNAGIGAGLGRREDSPDGVELRFAVNYLSGFLLTRLLLPLLMRSAPARIVNVSSAGQQAVDFDDPLLRRGYSAMRAYMQSKWAQVVFTFDLAEKLKNSGVTVNCLHPASFMDTTMVRQSGILPSGSIQDGTDALVRLVASPEVAEVTGEYFDGLHTARAEVSAYRFPSREALRSLSLQLCRLGAG